MQPVGRFGRAEQVIDAEARITLPAARGVVPEGVEPIVVGVERPQRFGPSLIDDPAPLPASFRLDQSVVRGSSHGEDIAVLRDDVPVAREDDWALLLKKLGVKVASSRGLIRKIA